jgi:hypothetical protein
MEPDCSLLHSQELSTCTYPEPDQSSPQHSIVSLMLSIRLHLTYAIKIILSDASLGCGWRDSLQQWRVAAHIFNNQSQTIGKGWSSGLGVGHGANNSSLLETSLSRKKVIKSLRTGWILCINDLSDGI